MGRSPIREGERKQHLYYVRQREYELRPVHLDEEERVALILAVEALRGTEGQKSSVAIPE